MALVKVVRDKPEVPGGNTTAMVDEKLLDGVLADGWKLAETKKEIKKEIEKEVIEPVNETVEKTEEKPADKPIRKTKKSL